MIIQIVLIALILMIGIYFMRSRGSSRTNAYKKLALLLFVVAAVASTLFPDALTAVANLLGVGRGADLLLYGLAVVVIFQLFNTYLKDKQDQRRTVVLARKIAIIEARAALKK